MTLLFTSLLWAFAGFLTVATLLPFSKIPNGAVRGLAFPRTQFFCAALGCALAFPFVHHAALGVWASAFMLVLAAVHLAFIVKFTPLWRRQSVDADAALLAQTDRHIRVLAANVKLSNRAYGRLIGLIKERQPDVVMAIEVDADWIAALKAKLAQTFDYWIDVPMDNGYGLCVMSRFALSETSVSELVTRNVPSIRTRVTLPSGQALRLYVVHPEPPVPNHDTIGRDSEIALAGLDAAQDDLPAIVSGDLNDVAWSTTTRRFQRLSGLLDPRVGRGLFNTFSATMPLMRWPLDHLFHDPQFRLIEMARLPKIGSDHFPLWFVLGLAERPAVNLDPGQVDAEEVAATRKTIEKEAKRDRHPIGEDWEDG